jgi:hydroxyacyl-ACP dehydratase HTD2-like protein with hotdog domain
MQVPMATFNVESRNAYAHRIHYDKEYARTEGHADVLVQAHLHVAVLARMLMDWMGPHGRLRALSWQNRGKAVPADALTCRGTVQRKMLSGSTYGIELEVSERNQRDEVCASGHATVELPARSMFYV